MDQQLSERGLSLRPFDPEVFARVWSRVMPDQALSPIQPALPALRSPAQTAPAPSCLGRAPPGMSPSWRRSWTSSTPLWGRSASWPGGAEAGPPACWPPSPPTSSGSSAACPPPIFSSPAGAMLPRGRGRPLWTAVLRLAHPVSAGPAVRRPGRRAGPDSFG